MPTLILEMSKLEMFCSNCGIQLPDDANFCLKCGKPQKAGIQVDEPKWETCEIKWTSSQRNLIANHKMQFWADAIGPNGSYNAGESPIFEHPYSEREPESNNRKDSDAHKNLISKLVADGWEPTGNRGTAWFSNRFRRRIKR